MNSRERQLATIRRESTDRISVDAINIENQAEIARYLDIDPANVLDRLGIDGRIVSAPYTGKVREPENGIYFTEWGTPNTGDYGTSRMNPLAEISSVSDVEKYQYPDPKQYDFTRASQWAKSLSEKYGVCPTYETWIRGG